MNRSFGSSPLSILSSCKFDNLGKGNNFSRVLFGCKMLANESIKLLLSDSIFSTIVVGVCGLSLKDFCAEHAFSLSRLLMRLCEKKRQQIFY